MITVRAVGTVSRHHSRPGSNARIRIGIVSSTSHPNQISQHCRVCKYIYCMYRLVVLRALGTALYIICIQPRGSSRLPGRSDTYPGHNV